MTSAVRFILLLVVGLALMPQVWAQRGTPEQILAELNRARTQPQEYARYLQARKILYQGKELHEPGKITILTEEGWPAVQEAINFLQQAQPLGPLTLSPQLGKAAQDHVKNIGPKGLVSHEGTDGSTPNSRIARYGQFQVISGENIAFGPEDARTIVANLIVDDGVEGRGHRTNIFRAEFKLVGIGVGPHKRFGWMCVMDLAGGFIPK